MMRFLIDNMLSVRLVDELVLHGHEAVHVRSLGLSSAPDVKLIEAAKQSGRVLLSADRDFGALLADLRSTAPSVIYLRGGVPRHPRSLALLIDANLPQVADAIAQGSIIVVEPARLRIRRLPIADNDST